MAIPVALEPTVGVEAILFREELREPWAVILLAKALVILGLQAGAAWAVGPYPTLGTALGFVAYGYGAAMGIRYVVRMARRPDQRWLGGCIPIVFHVVLASWLLIIASLWRQA